MSVDGTYKLTVNTQMGVQTPTLILKEEGGSLSGTLDGQAGKADFSGGTVDGNSASWEVNFDAMGQSIKLTCKATVDGDSISGNIDTPMGGADFTGQRES
jgi:hypothetical protein